MVDFDLSKPPEAQGITVDPDPEPPPPRAPRPLPQAPQGLRTEEQRRAIQLAGANEICHRDKLPCIGAACVLFVVEYDDDGNPADRGECSESLSQAAVNQVADRVLEILDDEDNKQTAATVAEIVKLLPMLAMQLGQRNES